MVTYFGEVQYVIGEVSRKFSEKRKADSSFAEYVQKVSDLYKAIWEENKEVFGPPPNIDTILEGPHLYIYATLGANSARQYWQLRAWLKSHGFEIPIPEYVAPRR